MRAGSKGATRIDHDRGCVVRRLVPRRADPEPSDADGVVESLPAVAPVSGHVLASGAAECLPEPFLATGIGVGDQLDAVRRLDLFEAFGKELEHLRPRFFRTLDGHGHRDPPHDAQRNALFSLSKNPSSGS